MLIGQSARRRTASVSTFRADRSLEFFLQERVQVQV